MKIKKILIANRGEIAVRIIRACRELGIISAAVYSDPDRSALHVRRADEAYPLGPATPSESYLHIEKIISAAKKAHADAIHPGYGFLSENAGFAKAVQEGGLIFIGPDSKAMEAMGSKIGARQWAQKAKVNIVPGIERPLADFNEARKVASQIGYPVLIKASAGGGGKGMRSVFSEKELESSFQMATSEALRSFKDGSVYIEKLIEGPHHVEIQILGDQQGNVVHLFERECSIQRRHQKVIEESPSPFITQETREAMCAQAVSLAKAVSYSNAGTLEFLVDKNQNFYFLEMNTRLQVEHPITEEVVGVDLVKTQIKIAEGERLPWKQEELSQFGHAIEVRVYAEDPFHHFMPAPGRVVDQQYPHGPGVRLDNGIYAGFDVPLDYDPILSKLICWGRTRTEAIERMGRALTEYRVSGPKTNLYFHRRAIQISDFVKGNYDTGFVDQHLKKILEIPQDEKIKAMMGGALAKYVEEKSGGGGVSPPKQGMINDVSNWRKMGRMEGLRK